MGFYKTPEEMYNARANRFKHDADRHWAQAKNGEGDYHYGKARMCYREAASNRAKAERAREAGETFGKRK